MYPRTRVLAVDSENYLKRNVRLILNKQFEICFDPKKTCYNNVTVDIERIDGKEDD